MVHASEIAKAIGTHGLWKQQLRQAIDTGRSELKVEKVRLSDECEFGRWLKSIPPADQQSEHYKHVQNVHAEFHIHAARVLGLAVSGCRGDAEKAVNVAGGFSDLSTVLTKAMMSWKDSC